MHTRCQIRIVQREFSLGTQEEIRQFVGCIHPFAGLSADSDSFPMCIAFLESTTSWAEAKIGKLSHHYPQAFQRFHRFLFGQNTIIDIMLIVWIEILVHTTIGNNCTRFLFQA